MQSQRALSSIRVEGLFRQRSVQTIVMERTFPTVLTGSNGSGKSTILRLVHAASTADVLPFARTSVANFALEFSDGKVFELTRPDSTHFELSYDSSSVRFPDKRGVLQQLPTWAQLALDFASQIPIRDQLENIAADMDVSLLDVRRAASTIEDWSSEVDYTPPLWFERFALSFPVLYITDNRLVVDRSTKKPTKDPRTRRLQRSRSSRLAVEEASERIASRMRLVDTEYARTSQNQDRRFPQRAIAAMNRPAPSERQFSQLLSDVIGARERLRSVGLLEGADEHFDVPLGTVESDSARQVMFAFLESSLDKLNVLNELEQRLRAFKGFLDERFFPKRLVFSRSRGIEIELAEGELLPSTILSSGEQQMLVLVYEILFKSKIGTLVLVDEPELSLHVSWQQSLVDSLVQIGEPRRLQFLLATHSPIVLANHPELDRSLDDPEST